MHLNISPSSAHLAEVRRAARLVLRPLPADVAHDLLLALDEAVSNAVEHGSAGGHPVEVSIEYSQGWVELRVLDRGPTPKVPALPADPPAPMALGGRGLWLIRQLSDEVRVEPAGSGTLLAIRRRTGGSESRPGRAGSVTGHRSEFDQVRLDRAPGDPGMSPAARRPGHGRERPNRLYGLDDHGHDDLRERRSMRGRGGEASTRAAG
jgi:anti-sigma regulatory factor (Ser/Thr protein kinase)